MRTLIDFVKDNDPFLTRNCNGDLSFKSFILSTGNIKTDEEFMELEKFKSRTKNNINLNKHIKIEQKRYILNFSKIIANKRKDKAILFVTDDSSGSWVLVELTQKGWTVKHEIPFWITVA